MRSQFAAHWRAAVLTLGLGWLTAGPLEAQLSREYDVKAAFLYNFATFVEWPATAFDRPDSPFVIGVLGSDPFGPVLEEIVRDERIKGRPVVIRRFNRLDPAGPCHILFISSSEKRHLNNILQYVRDRPMLTVSDLPDFAEAGGMVGFTTSARVGLRINAAALRAANLTMSSKLLRLGQVIESASFSP